MTDTNDTKAKTFWTYSGVNYDLIRDDVSEADCVQPFQLFTDRDKAIASMVKDANEPWEDEEGYVPLKAEDVKFEDHYGSKEVFEHEWDGTVYFLYEMTVWG